MRSDGRQNLERHARRPHAPGLPEPSSSDCLTSSSATSQARIIDKSALVCLGASPDAHGLADRPDLLIAATAELIVRTVLHLDKDFDLIANLTQQPTERLDGP